MGTIPDPITTVESLIDTYWDTYKASYGTVTKPNINYKGDVKDVRGRHLDEVLIFTPATASRSGHDGYRDIGHSYRGRLHRVQIDIRTWVDRTNLTNMLNIINNILEVYCKSPGTGYDKITFPYGDGTDFSSEKNGFWRWVFDIALVKEYALLHS